MSFSVLSSPKEGASVASGFLESVGVIYKWLHHFSGVGLKSFGKNDYAYGGEIALCIEMGFTWKFQGKLNSIGEVKSEVIFYHNLVFFE